jgi:hypothetical protein
MPFRPKSIEMVLRKDSVTGKWTVDPVPIRHDTPFKMIITPPLAKDGRPLPAGTPSRPSPFTCADSAFDPTTGKETSLLKFDSASIPAQHAPNSWTQPFDDGRTVLLPMAVGPTTENLTVQLRCQEHPRTASPAARLVLETETAVPDVAYFHESEAEMAMESSAGAGGK